MELVQAASTSVGNANALQGEQSGRHWHSWVAEIQHRNQPQQLDSDASSRGPYVGEGCPLAVLQEKLAEIVLIGLSELMRGRDVLPAPTTNLVLVSKHILRKHEETTKQHPNGNMLHRTMGERRHYPFSHARQRNIQPAYGSYEEATPWNRLAANHRVRQAYKLGTPSPARNSLCRYVPGQREPHTC